MNSFSVKIKFQKFDSYEIMQTLKLRKHNNNNNNNNNT